MNDRQKRIYEIIVKIGNVRIDHLEKEVFASGATIRRDLKKMESMRLISRVWGGAVLYGKADIDPPSFVRESVQTDAKRKIARKALSFITENSSVFLPSGSTVTELSKILGSYKDLTVITTCVNVINILKTYSSFNVLVPGGELYEHYDFVGSLTKSFINKLSADLFFFSCSGITAEGFTSKDINRLDIIDAMRLNAAKHILLCDSSKVGKKYTYKGFDFDNIDFVIMDEPPKDQDLIKALGK
ncbi:MAG: DeoR/GlpR transcriptional regulator, partial [Clostridia bacterium]|nr:DeoR/GlpR transcriptional regulator [Clostridia bacterium]